jgi:release factor glutamine methyltransferase
MKIRPRLTSAVQETFCRGAALLHGVPNPAVEAKVLLMLAAGLDEVAFLASPQRTLTSREEKEFYRLVARRLSGRPLAYITGQKEFWSGVFKIAPGVLIPRPETELIVELVLGLPGPPRETIADIGTGSGNIAISLAGELPGVRIVATDISVKALELARLNARRQAVKNVTFRRGSLYSPLADLGLRGRCDVIVSNPPYVSAADWSSLPAEVREHEPKRALFGGPSGLEFIERLVRGAPDYLRTGGSLLFEIGQGQSDRALSLFDERWRDVGSYPDLQGIPRVIKATRV